MTLRPSASVVALALALGAAAAATGEEASGGAEVASGLWLSDCDESEPVYPCYVESERGAVPVNGDQEHPAPGAVNEGSARGVAVWSAGDPVLVYRRFTRAALQETLRLLPDPFLMEHVERLNARAGAQTARELVRLVAEMELLVATDQQIQFAVRDFSADPDPGTAERILERLVIDRFELPEELFGRGWSAADLIQTLEDFQKLGGTVPAEQLTPEFFDAYQDARRSDDTDAFVAEWLERFSESDAD